MANMGVRYKIMYVYTVYICIHMYLHTRMCWPTHTDTRQHAHTCKYVTHKHIHRHRHTYVHTYISRDNGVIKCMPMHCNMYVCR